MKAILSSDGGIVKFYFQINGLKHVYMEWERIKKKCFEDKNHAAYNRFKIGKPVITSPHRSTLSP